uniref:JmjC domain-containing protein n=1 Tax=Mycena chlorophos TaxID=658473 RepID=A0ABQ0KZX8_MYCCL|nr:predicted protein [Mycena chlorophos]
MLKPLGLRTTRSGREWSNCRMEIFEIEADTLTRRTASELREDSDDGYSDDALSDDEDEEPAAEPSRRRRVTSAGRPFDTTITASGSKRQLTEVEDGDCKHDGREYDGCTRVAPLAEPPLHFPSHQPLNIAQPAAEPRNEDRQRMRRRKKRKLKREEEAHASGSNIKPFCAKRSAQATRTRVEIDLDSSAAQEPVSSTGFVCLNDATLNGRRAKAAKGAAKKAASVASSDNAPLNTTLLPTTGKFTKAEMESMGMTEDKWDGFVLPLPSHAPLTGVHSISQVVYVDAKGRKLAVLCGQPRDTTTSDWGCQVAQAGFELMQELAPKLSPLDGDSSTDGKKRKRKRKKKRNVRRGDHRAETVGVGIGNGRKGPQNFHTEDEDAAILDTLLASEPFVRLAEFANSILLNFAPRLHHYYEKTMDALFNWDPRLRRIFKRGTSVFPSCTFNFGPQTVTVPHLDLLNLAWGWCFITAFGNFDPDKGGHLILWDLKRIIRFPPGATIAIPSALLRHSNVTIQQDETRYSFTQFAAGGLFRFVESGFRLNASLAEQVAGMSDEELNKFVEERAVRFAKGLEMYGP